MGSAHSRDGALGSPLVDVFKLRAGMVCCNTPNDLWTRTGFKNKIPHLLPAQEQVGDYFPAPLFQHFREKRRYPSDMVDAAIWRQKGRDRWQSSAQRPQE